MVGKWKSKFGPGVLSAILNNCIKAVDSRKRALLCDENTRRKIGKFSFPLISVCAVEN